MWIIKEANAGLERQMDWTYLEGGLGMLGERTARSRLLLQEL